MIPIGAHERRDGSPVNLVAALASILVDESLALDVTGHNGC